MNRARGSKKIKDKFFFPALQKIQEQETETCELRNGLLCKYFLPGTAGTFTLKPPHWGLKESALYENPFYFPPALSV